MIKKLLRKVIRSLPVRNYILFESVPDLSDNTKAVFDKMLERGLNNKYRFIWQVSKKDKTLPNYKNTVFIDPKTFSDKLLYKYYTATSKCIICCNQFIGSWNKKQKAFYLTHGTVLKSVRHYYVLPENIDYMLIASEGTKSLMAYEYKTDESKIFALGFPRNDEIQEANLDLHPYIKADYKKLIVWYPTFRQHKNGNKTGSCNALPILSDTQSANQLNDVAKAKGVVIVIKPHFAQDIKYIKDHNLSNIKFIDDSFFVKNKISSYQFVGSCDALITDYSSIYYDFLLCNKPIGLVWEDIEAYRQEPGFAVDVDEIGKAAEKIYDLDDFKAFISDLADGNDGLSTERNALCKWANYAQDGKNADRVVDFIMEKANL